LAAAGFGILIKQQVEYRQGSGATEKHCKKMGPSFTQLHFAQHGVLKKFSPPARRICLNGKNQ
jgi:hypothetical protein